MHSVSYILCYMQFVNGLQQYLQGIFLLEYWHKFYFDVTHEKQGIFLLEY